MTGAEQKGRAEGLAEGEYKGHLDVAKKLKVMGLSDEDNACATGLSLEDIQQL